MTMTCDCCDHAATTIATSDGTSLDFGPVTGPVYLCARDADDARSDAAFSDFRALA